MAFKLAFSTLRWKNPDLEPCLVALKEVGWAGWECRLPLDWLGTPQRLRRICDNVGLPMVVYTAVTVAFYLLGAATLGRLGLEDDQRL